MSALDYTDGNTVAERDYGRQQDRLFDEYDRRDARRDEFRIQAESDWWDEINIEGWTMTSAQEQLAERALPALCRLAEHTAGRAPGLYPDNGYQQDLDRVKQVMDEWIEDRTETLIVDGDL